MTTRTFVAALDLAQPDVLVPVRRPATPEDDSARVLVRRGRHVLGFAEAPVRKGAVDAEALHSALARFPNAMDRGGQALATPPITVVVCTRDRPELLATCLDHIAALRYPAFEILVVDNAPSDDRTRELVEQRMYSDARMRYTVEPRPGLSRARNHALGAARTRIVAFTDDDVMVDGWWLHGIAEGFARDRRVGCVTGIVAAAELDDDGQRYFEQRYSWSAHTEARLYDLDEQRDDSPLYPYSAGLFGTGANFAVDRVLMQRIGGFDEALGAGTACAGGEDLDAFVRILHSGAQIAYEPSALVWHRHRGDEESQQEQLKGYGVGLTAYLWKCLRDPRMRWDIVRRVPRGALKLRRALGTPANAAPPRGAKRAELGGMLRGPRAYARAVAASDGRRLSRRTAWTTGVAFITAALLWAAAIPRINPNAVNSWGLLPALPAIFVVSLVLLVASTGWLLTRETLAPKALAAHLGAFIVFIHATPALVFGQPVYAWLYKHVGVVAYIATNHRLDPSVDIYQNWPGFFALAAWLGEVSGMGDPIAYAAWAQVFFNLVACLELRFVFAALDVEPRVRWIGLFLFVFGNWVGQDYFAPQALAFVLGLASFAMVLTWCRRRPEQKRPRPALVVCLYVTFAAVVVTHQLSPAFIVASVAVLTLLAFVRPFWIVVGLAAITAAYIAARYEYLSSTQDLVGPIGDPIRNLLGRPSDSVPVTARRVTAFGAPLLTLFLSGLGAIGLWRRWRQRKPVAIVVVLACTPVSLAFAQNYGGEMVFRIYLYGLPWVALLAAYGLAPGGRLRRMAPLTVAAGLAIALGLLLVTMFGAAELHRVRDGEVAASRYFYAHAEPGAVLTLATLNFPTRVSGNYNEFTIAGTNPPTLFTTEKELRHRMLGPDDVATVTDFVRTHMAAGTGGYFVLSHGQADFAEILGLTPRGALASLDAALAASPDWSVFYRNVDATIYRLAEGPPAPPRSGPSVSADPDRALPVGAALAVAGPAIVFQAARRRRRAFTSSTVEQPMTDQELTATADADVFGRLERVAALDATTPAGVAALCNSLRDDLSPRVRASAVARLASADPATQLRVLHDALEDPAAEVRAAALDALAAAREPAAGRLVVTALDDADSDVRAAAQRCIAHGGDWLLWLVLQESTRPDEVVDAVVVELGAERVGAMFAERIGSPLVADRRLAITLCPRVRSDATDSAVDAALFDDDEEVRQRAVQALSSRVDATDKLLRVLLDDPSATVRAAALRAVRSHDDDRVRHALVEAIADDDAPIRRLAADALVLHSSRGLAQLLVAQMKRARPDDVAHLLLRMGRVGEDALADAVNHLDARTARTALACAAGTEAEKRWRRELGAMDPEARRRARCALAMVDARSNGSADASSASGAATSSS